METPHSELPSIPAAKARKPRSKRKAPSSPEAAASIIGQAELLGAMRQALGRTQLDVSRGLGVGQGAVAQLEQRSDLLLSTLVRYMAAMGAEISITLTTADGAQIPLRGLSALRGESAAGKRRGRRPETQAEPPVL